MTWTRKHSCFAAVLLGMAMTGLIAKVFIASEDEARASGSEKRSASGPEVGGRASLDAYQPRAEGCPLTHVAQTLIVATAIAATSLSNSK